MSSEEQHPEITDVAVFGATLAGLTVARDLARRGYRVTVLTEQDAAGGSARALQLKEHTVSARAEGFVDDSGAVRRLANELELTLEPKAESHAIRLPNRTVPMPEDTVLGIPGSPLAQDVIDVIGWGGALRAYSDRLRPVLKIGRFGELGPLVRKRMGSAVIDRMFEPVARATFGAHPDELAVAATLPELNGAITRSGSLSGAVSMLRADLDSDDRHRVLHVTGGLHTLVAALIDDAVDYHAQLHLQTAVDLAERDEEGWLLTLTNGERLRAQVLVDADTDTNAPVRCALLVPHESVESAYSRIFVAPAEQSVQATDMQLTRTADGTVLTLSYRGAAPDAEAAEQQAVRDAETLFGIRIGTPIAHAHTPYWASKPDRPVPAEGVLRIGGGFSLSNTIEEARKVAAAIRREDFAVTGTSWTTQINEDAHNAERDNTEQDNTENEESA